MLEKRATGLKLPLKSHGYLYEVLASYQAPAVAVAQKETLAIAGKSSQTMVGLAALENMKYGGSISK